MTQGPRHATMCSARRPVRWSWAWVGGHVNFYAVTKGEVGGDAMLIEAIRGCCLHIGVVRCGEAVESGGGGAKGIGVSCR
jgi:hypothetical protein